MTAFYYGTQFYRAPSPPRDERRQHLERIVEEAGFNIIKIWPTWTWCNPEEGSYEFEELHEIMAACDELGLKVNVNPSLESAPYWLEQRYPDSRFVSALGEVMYLRGMQCNPTGGWPGLCTDHPCVRRLRVPTGLGLLERAHDRTNPQRPVLGHAGCAPVLLLSAHDSSLPQLAEGAIRHPRCPQ